MRNLESSLYDHELVVLRVIGEWWELDLTGSQKKDCVLALTEVISHLDMAVEVSYLGPEEAATFEDLLQAGGRISVTVFERKHGTVRQMGPGRLEREEPWLDPVSPAEGLWYRGFMFRAFDETEQSSLTEFYYLPNGFREQFQPLEDNIAPVEVKAGPGLIATDRPVRFKSQVTDSVDDITSILAILQNQALESNPQEQIQPFLVNSDERRLHFLLSLASDLGLLRETESGKKPARQALIWLKISREAQLRDLSDTWTRSSWNDLHYTPGVVCEENNWTNDPISARTALLDALPRDTSWYRLADLVAQIKETDPDFQRPNGNYSTWYIRDEESGDYIAGFANWDLVEGRLLRFLVTGPLVWLGMVEIDASRVTSETKFKLTSRAEKWLANIEVKSEEVEVPIVVRNDASIQVPYNSSRFYRFQVARVADPQPVERDRPFIYRLSPRSLRRARDQGIEPERLKKFLEEASGRPLPSSTMRAIERWAEFGSEARLDMAVVLRVRDPEVLDKLRTNRKTRPFIGEALGDMAVLISQDDWPELVITAAQLGLLLDINEQ